MCIYDLYILDKRIAAVNFIGRYKYERRITMDRYTKYCTKKQSEKAYGLGAPMDKPKYVLKHVDRDIKNCYAVIPRNDEYLLFYFTTVEQMCGWLRSLGFQFYVTDAINDCRIDVWRHELTGHPDDRNGDSDEFIGMFCGKNYDSCILNAINKALEFLETKMKK